MQHRGYSYCTKPEVDTCCSEAHILNAYMPICAQDCIQCACKRNLGFFPSNFWALLGYTILHLRSCRYAASPHSSASWWTSASSSPERQHWTMTAQENCSWKCSFTHMENNIIHIDNVPTWASLDFSKNRRGNGETGNIYIDHLQQCRQDR